MEWGSSLYIVIPLVVVGWFPVPPWSGVFCVSSFSNPYKKALLQPFPTADFSFLGSAKSVVQLFHLHPAEAG